ncbi:hypothetical protein AQPE_3963 [Aquipluma nitroreducens]|uniref:Uncharacterized protein n=1 Tax=Aquipluma nitroreducens TaxID=2010828 RepID=A0A5K7SE62_9BACT|nr:hypothetical protein AQPE_3963 [Aquipluma nitroreducens]
MDVAGHYAPCKNLHSFFFLAIMQAIDDYVFVFVAGKLHPTTQQQQSL